MKRRRIIHTILITLILFNMSFSYAYWASSISGSQVISNVDVNIGSWDYENIVSIYTGFEDVSKTAYAIGDIETYGYTWTLNDALVGTDSNDKKNETKSARLRNGHLETQFTVSNIRSISFFVGTYGSDTASPLKLEISDDQTTWKKYADIIVTTTFTKLTIDFKEVDVVALGLSRADDLYIRFSSTNTKRANIDDISINYYLPYIESYLTGFESSEGFTSSTTYNNQTIKYEGSALNQWGFYYGTPSTTSPISNSQSAQMRWYTSAPSNLGYMFTNFDIIKLKSVTFVAKNTSSINVLVSMSIDGGVTWIESTLFSLSTTSTLYTYDIDSSYLDENIRLKFEINFATTPTSTSRLYIDDISILTKY